MTREVVIVGRPRPHLRHALVEVWGFRAIILAFAEREIRVKYKQAVFGIGWVALQPLAYMAVFTVALGRLAGVPGGGVPYAAFSLAVLAGWSLLQNSVSTSSTTLITDADLLRKVYFPREVPILGTQLAALLDFAVALALFAVIGPFLGARVSVTWLLAPLLGLGLLALATGVALGIAALNVYYRDFRYVVPFLLQLWLFASPVAYPLTVVPERWQLLYVALNPAAGYLDAFRRTLAMGVLPDPRLLGISVLATVLVLGFGYRLFKALEPNFADVV